MTELDPVFVEVANAVYGDLLDPRELWDLAKLDAADVHVNGSLKRKKAIRKDSQKSEDDKHSNTARALVLGGAAEGLGTYRAGQLAHQVITAPKVKAATSLGGKLKAVGGGGGAKVGEFGLQAANLGIGLVAAHKLSQNAKKQPIAKVRPAPGPPPLMQRAGAKLGLKPVNMAMTDKQAAKFTRTVGSNMTRNMRGAAGLGVAAGAGVGAVVMAHHKNKQLADDQVAKGMLKPVATAAPTSATPPLAAGVRAVNTGGVGRGLGRRGHALGPQATGIPTPKPVPLVKSLTITGEISKIDEDKHQVFGWCTVTHLDNEPVVDRQGDYVPIDEIEKSAYVYVLESRKGGDMHSRVRKGISTDWDQPKHTADLIESVVFTPEKLEKMGMVSKSGQLGWWVGFKVNDEEQWQLFKSGERTGFSIHGSGSRSDVVM
jgi:hypothetical protein